MALTVNEGGVLRTLGSVSVNDGGVIRNLGSVSANDGGVIREIHSANKFKITGVTPLVLADDHAVIVSSVYSWDNATISLPAGARIVIGGSGYGTFGGCVAAHTISTAINNASFTATISAAIGGSNQRANATYVMIGGVKYSCGSTAQVIQSKWGPIGGEGGIGQEDGYDGDNDVATDGTGAGGGGGFKYGKGDPKKGGNNGGYGNFGGNGASSSVAATDGACGKAGSDKIGGNGGGGGYAAGGGDCYVEYVYSDDGESYDTIWADEGEAGTGIVVFEW